MRREQIIEKVNPTSFLFSDYALIMGVGALKMAEQYGAQIVSINDSDSYVKGSVSFSKQAKEILKQNPNSKIQVIINAHGSDDGKTIFFEDGAINRNVLLQDLAISDHVKNSEMDVYQLSCHAGAGLVRTVKNNEERHLDASQDLEGNYNQEELTNSLPPNWQLTICAGKYTIQAAISKILIGSLIQNHQLSPFVKKIQLMLFPQTFKWFKKKADGTLADFKYDALKPEELIEELLKANPTISPEELHSLICEKYKNHIKSKIDEFKNIYLANNQISDSELEQIEEGINTIKSQIDSDPKVIADYINMDFVIAVGEGKLERVRSYIKHQQAFNFDVNYDFSRMTPLCSVCEKENLEIVKELLKAKNIDVEKSSSLGTPLEIAFRKKNLGIVKELLRAGAKLDQEFFDDIRFNLIKNNALDLLQFLIDEKNMDITTFDLSLCATRHGSIEMVNFLLDKIPSEIVNRKTDEAHNQNNNIGQYAVLYTSSRNGDIDKLKAILNHPKVMVDRTFLDLLKQNRALDKKDKNEISKLIQEKIEAQVECKIRGIDEQVTPNPNPSKTSISPILRFFGKLCGKG